MSITLDVSAGLLNEPDEVLLGLVVAGHVGSWTGAGGGGGGGGGRMPPLPFVVLLEAVIGPSSSSASAASSSELIPCLLDANGFFPPNKSFPPNFETPPASKAFFFL